MPTHLDHSKAAELFDPQLDVPLLNMDPEAIWACYHAVRRTTEALCAPLEIEDYVIQSMPDASPTKWHLAHTTWFFETFILNAEQAGGAALDRRYSYLFNSYYEAVGERIARDRRGLLSRPTVTEVLRYRSAVDKRVQEFLARADAQTLDRVRGTIVLGMHHEQQHQELILTDIKHALSCNPLRPAYHSWQPGSGLHSEVSPLGWAAFEEGVRSIGHTGTGFAFDNETPRHPVFVPAFALADRLITNREFLEFIADGGYDHPEFWLSDGWFARNRNKWSAPLYWESIDDERQAFTLAGVQELDLDAPVCHVSYYEADAFARWSGARLGTEAEWETAASASRSTIAGSFLESKRFHPAPIMKDSVSASRSAPFQLFGDVWEWTQSPYTPYHGFRPAAGALGEYNGKFMCNQLVLRGGSCATPRSHIRATYRNFFPPEARWQFSGIRLAKDV
jgi:ergothioneine biosynthesis protein EgtB